MLSIQFLLQLEEFNKDLDPTHFRVISVKTHLVSIHHFGFIQVKLSRTFL